MPRHVAYHRLPTEQPHPRTAHLDRLPLDALLEVMNREDRAAVRAVGRQRRAIARAVRLIAASLHAGGRLLFVGAGTSGRLGVLEAAECPPTFSTPPSMVQAVIAGGRGAVFRSREGAEDRRLEARRQVLSRVREGDVVVGITASGVTPFVDEALRAAARGGARTVLLTGNPRSPIPAQVRIALRAGPEVLVGSTRLKMGTATKLVLNMLTLGAMVRLGKTYGHLMVDVRPTSRKLRARALRIIQTVSRRPAPQAARALRASRGRVKAAILMAQAGLNYPAAVRRLLEADGVLRRALHTGVRPQSEKSRNLQRGV